MLVFSEWRGKHLLPEKSQGGVVLRNGKQEDGDGHQLPQKTWKETPKWPKQTGILIQQTFPQPLERESREWSTSKQA